MRIRACSCRSIDPLQAHGDVTPKELYLTHPPLSLIVVLSIGSPPGCHSPPIVPDVQSLCCLPSPSGYSLRVPQCSLIKPLPAPFFSVKICQCRSTFTALNKADMQCTIRCCLAFLLLVLLAVSHCQVVLRNRTMFAFLAMPPCEWLLNQSCP